jgi:hypothetical protein
MKQVCVTVTAAALAALAMFGQQVTVTKSLSNIKNNIAVSQNPNGTFKCVADGQPCTKDHVQALSDIATNREVFWKSGGAIKSLAYAPDGSLTCTTTDGKKCTSALLAELNNTAMAMTSVKPVQGVGVGLGKPNNPSK